MIVIEKVEIGCCGGANWIKVVVVFFYVYS